jgi:hypothetical protein
MAVHGATPRRISPARYDWAISEGRKPLKTMVRNTMPRRAMVKGLIAQLAISVAAIGFGVFPALITAVKGICTIMGYIIKNKQIATGMEMPA